jgi:hypothetical protein
MRDHFVKLPRTSVRNCPQSFAKLLTRVDPNARRGGFHGTLIRPGAVVPENALWPTPEYPRIPVLLECAGVEGGRGHRRAPCLWLIWRYDPDAREWTELGRALASDWTWELSLRPIAVQAMKQGQPEAVPPDLGALCDRLLAAVAAELRRLNSTDQARVLATLEHDLSAWYAGLDLG